jgi:hypothetical protein
LRRGRRSRHYRSADAWLYNNHSDFMAHDDSIGRLARQVDASRRFEPSLMSAEEVSRLRRQGACQLHQICAEFVSSLNSKLPRVPFELSPPAYDPEMFREPDVTSCK